MRVFSWLKKLRESTDEPSPDSATSDAAHEADARKADIGGTFWCGARLTPRLTASRATTRALRSSSPRR